MKYLALLGLAIASTSGTIASQPSESNLFSSSRTASFLIAQADNPQTEEQKKICSAFRRNDNGSWTSVKAVTIGGPNGQVQIGPGVTFTRGVLFMGIDLAARLDETCQTEK